MTQTTNQYPENGTIPVPELDPRQKALRDTFVAEYLIDYNKVAAAMRCGFPREFAVQYSQQFMDEPYVQMRLQALSFTPVNEQDEVDFNKRRIKNQLLKEAFYYGPGSSHAARVSALANLSKVYGMEAPKKLEASVKHSGGVMRVPGAVSVEDWESAAVASQESLTRDAG